MICYSVGPNECQWSILYVLRFRLQTLFVRLRRTTHDTHNRNVVIRVTAKLHLLAIRSSIYEPQTHRVHSTFNLINILEPAAAKLDTHIVTLYLCEQTKAPIKRKCVRGVVRASSGWFRNNGDHNGRRSCRCCCRLTAPRAEGCYMGFLDDQHTR